MYMRTYALANNNKVQYKPPLKTCKNPSETNPSTNQRVSEKIAKTLKKVVDKQSELCYLNKVAAQQLRKTF